MECKSPFSFQADSVWYQEVIGKMTNSIEPDLVTQLWFSCQIFGFRIDMIDKLVIFQFMK